MDPLLALVLGLAIGLGLGAVIGLLLARSRRADARLDPPELVAARHESAIAAVRAEESTQRAELIARLSGAEASTAGLREQLASAQQQYRELIERTSAEQRAVAERERAESRVLQALTPVQETLRTMQSKVTELEQQRSIQHGELSQQLRTATQSEENLRATAESLASALRSNNTRGAWGETQLRRLVEAAGLLEHVDFTEQHGVSSDAGAGRIDMVVHLSDGKSLAIDAKVPFDAFLEASRIPPTATGVEAERREKLLREHVKAMRGHVDALAKREYWSGLAASPDLVIGFIPSESLVAAALETDPALLDYAFRKNVALASPVTLWAVLKTVAYSWRQEALSKDAKRLFDLSTELYGRLRTLAEHSEKLRRSIESTVTNYNTFAASLESRVLVTARKINDNGDPSLEIAETKGIDSSPRALTAPHLIGELPSTDGHEDDIAEPRIG